MSTKTIRIRKDVKERLDVFADGTPINKAMRRLLENADISDEIIKSDYINIHMDEDLLNRLHRCKRYSTESHSDVISRLLDDAMSDSER